MNKSYSSGVKELEMGLIKGFFPHGNMSAELGTDKDQTEPN